MAIELESTQTPLQPADDGRPKIFEPPPVRLVAIEDCSLPAVAGIEPELDAFYIGLLRFEREMNGSTIIYKAENFRLRFNIIERPAPRSDMRPLGVAVPSLNEIMQRLLDAKIEFTRERGLTPGLDRLLLTDPAANFIEISEFQHSI